MALPLPLHDAGTPPQCKRRAVRHRLRSAVFRRPSFKTSAALNQKDQILKQALKAVSEITMQLREVGFEELTVDLRLGMSKIRREINHREAVKDHPDLFM
jgi:hypothetical protein